jgi:hypothetical protein
MAKSFPEYKELSDDEYQAIIRSRGGCNCAYLGSVGGAPCHNCTDTITDEEMEDYGTIIEITAEPEIQPEIDEPFYKHIHQFIRYKSSRFKFCLKCDKIKT